MRRLLLVTLALLATATAAVTTFAEEPASHSRGPVSHSRGLVKQKPTSGRFIETKRGFMVPYIETIAGTDVTFEMIPVPGGRFTFGTSVEGGEGDSSGEGDNRGEYELSAVEVELPPFWIAKHEVTWSMYWRYMRLIDDFAKLQTLNTLLHATDPNAAAATRTALSDYPKIVQAAEHVADEVDGVTAPTPLYDPDNTYQFGKDPQQPAATITPYAAKQFTKWLSLSQGVSYRLPTEAEWEYAARAGSTTVYPFGDDPAGLDAYAWYEENSDAMTHPVGEKKPNAWGLHDMIGNVAEWVIDQYDEDNLQRTSTEVLTWEQAIRWPTDYDGRVVRGGFWDDYEEDCRSTSRFYSEDEDWKSEDPNLPLSPWWYTAYPSSGVGIRLVRPLEPLSLELSKKFWEPNSEDMALDVADRLRGERGKFGAVNAQLPQVQTDLESAAVRKLLEN